jgi:rod shape-determining protein MreB
MLSLTEQPRFRQWLGGVDLAIDLGTANTRLFATGQGLVAEEPSLVSIQAMTGRVAAIGREAVQLTLEGQEILPLAPLHSGVIADVEAASLLLRHLLERTHRLGILKPRALVCAPTDAQEDEKALLIEATRRAGASAVAVVPEPLAAAIGAGLEVFSPYAQMLVDIGDGVTDIAVIRSGELTMTSAVRTACSDLHRAISRQVAVGHGVQLSPQEAERLTCRAGQLVDGAREEKIFLTQGIDLGTGEPVSLGVSAEEILASVEPIIETILTAIVKTFDALPVETSCEVIENGIWVTGGGALLPRLTRRLAETTSLDVRLAEDPLRSVIFGACQMLEVGSRTGIWRSRQAPWRPSGTRRQN